MISDRAKVCVRVKPPSPNRASCLNVFENTVSFIGSDEFIALDEVFDHGTPNITIYERMVRYIVLGSMGGLSGTVIVYGQTDTGKTYTMTGSDNTPGVISFALDELFNLAAAEAEETPEWEVKIKASYLEIYNGKIWDLHELANPNIALKANLKDDVTISGVHCQVVSTVRDVLKLIERGKTKRHTTPTNMNPCSSRSHVILRLNIKKKRKNKLDSRKKDIVWHSILNFVDLGGFERASKTGAAGGRLVEAGSKNQSLMHLRQVVAKLGKPEKQRGFVSYRDCTLTWILQCALGGTSNACLVCTVASEKTEKSATKETFEFAKEAMVITNTTKPISLRRLLPQRNEELKQNLDEMKKITLESEDVTRSNMEQEFMMSRPLYNAVDVNPSMRRWTVLIQVIERGEPKDSRVVTNPVKYRSYLITDMQGTCVSMVTYGNDIPFFASTLVPFNRYYVSNAYVRKARAGYEVSHYRYTWTLNNSTLVEPIVDDSPFTLPCRFNFTPFSQFVSIAGQERSIDIKALVIKAFQWKKVKDDLESKDYVVIDNENTPILLRTWRNPKVEVGPDLGHALPFPLFIVATDVRVTTFQGLSLTTRYSTSFLKDPPIPEAFALKEWYTANADLVNEMLEIELYKDVSVLVGKPKLNDILSIETAINTIDELKTVWIQGAVKLASEQQNFWYACCSNCSKSLRGDVGWHIWCEACKENTEIALRFNFEITLEDGSGVIRVTLYAEDVEKLLPITLPKLLEEKNEGKNIETMIRTAIGGKEVICFIKVFDKPVKDLLVRKYPVVKMYLRDEVFGSVARIAEPTVAAPSSLANSVNESVILAVPAMSSSFAGKEFFSPTTKCVLEEIASGSTAASVCMLESINRELKNKLKSANEKIKVLEKKCYGTLDTLKVLEGRVEASTEEIKKLQK